MSTEKQIKSTVKIYHFKICNVGKIIKYIYEKNGKLLVSSLIIAHIDYYKAICCGLPHFLLHRQQRLQNTAAARLVSYIHKPAHITPISM